MSRATSAKYRRLARILHTGMAQAPACVKAGIHATLEGANKGAYLTVRNPIVVEELARLEGIETSASVMSKNEKLEVSANMSRELGDKIQAQLESEEPIDHKLIDSFIKLGKRDDVLQGHQISAETNPQDRIDMAISSWVMEVREGKNQPNQTRVIDVESEVV